MAKLNDEIRTKAWTHYVASVVAMDDVGGQKFTGWLGESDTSKVHLLERKTGVLAQNWSRYRTGDRNVGASTLKRVEQKVKGSSDIYYIGPEEAPLWTALWSDDEQELWRVSKATSGIVQVHQAWNSDRYNLCDFTRVESTKIYYTAMSEYYEEKTRTGKGLLDMDDMAALIAAFRLGQFRREAAKYQEILGCCLELSLTEGSLALIILRDYGILDYCSNFVDRLIPHSEKPSQVIPLISRQSAFDNYNEGLNEELSFDEML
ncbi:MAG: hypothetical protein JAZ20_10790 [Candidatus Thiodiazotropha weberae]|nr:hypothetical protein [Candidatus Thiodiazotropha lotti]MCG8013910.1 hypothetical protein [Candidatus Thiodiazotropha lotti]MCG8020897.1 hypothetical protein [Candidatus Thiodiazotropha lotti]MCW4208063.1 hypothetical protein [Candidatus Thiodiazotropha lotti]MCW4213391.1 hypothetical protein [Candidatus Thiodiazotropha lotti]